MNEKQLELQIVTSEKVKKVAIMQPTYLPWIGYFGLMKSVDYFVLLDSVQFSKRSWQQRNKIKTSTGEQWLTVPVLSKGKREQKICDVKIDYSRGFHLSHIRALEQNYRSANFFDEYYPLVRNVLLSQPEKLVELNFGIINLIRQILDISTPIIRSSEMSAKGENASLLCNICLELGATEYVSPPGSRVYLDTSDDFEKVDIPVKYFDFQCRPYIQQYGEFIPFLSAVDLIFNCGRYGLNMISEELVTHG